VNSLKLEPTERLILAFNVIYVGAFTAYFLLIGNYEFLWYVATLVGLIVLIIVTRRTGAFTAGILWALSLWGFAHMAGGGVPVGDGVLYNQIVLPLSNGGELSLLKFDKVVHFYGFAVVAWLLWHILQFHFESEINTRHAGVRLTPRLMLIPFCSNLKDVIHFVPRVESANDEASKNEQLCNRSVCFAVIRFSFRQCVNSWGDPRPIGRCRHQISMQSPGKKLRPQL
jgi:hypothetical protein